MELAEPTGGGPVPAIDVDGRHQRRDRNKTAVLDAYLDLIGEGNDSPSVAEVATRSGVSHRSVFRYFSDKDDLARTSIERHLDRIKPLLWIQFYEEESLEQRVDRVIAARLNLFPSIDGVARLQRRVAQTSSVVKEVLTRNRALARAQLRWLFSPELDAMEYQDALDTLYAVDVMCSFEAGDLFIHDQQLDVETTARVVRRALLSLLCPR
ncbi:MAG: putative TetR family transcriptional regulator [Ilumatobacteraceae bacterium]|nr:putative TetR family transcriptional regulator [Ilumatobacteraceae bacterium]MCU1388046.1 putative TetR family transcriptional regulator [Ilumatobacteraceae bacterium]